MTSGESHIDLERRALELLPWYVNGTLEGEERELVSRQVLASLACRKELERLRRLQQLIQREDPEAAAASRAFERLMARIDASGASPRSPARHSGRAFAVARFALAASLAPVAAALLWWLAADSSGTPPTYETLTRSQPADPAAARLRVVFAPGVTEPEQRELLSSLGLTTVGTPTTDAIVTLAIPDEADQAAIVAALKRDPRIRLVTSPPATNRP